MTRDFDFYIVPTPIGNLSDITLRALEILKKADIIACEDTRTTQKLLNHYNINTRCISYHKYNEQERVDYILSELKCGKKIALVSDAGTPLICDPGSIVIDKILENGYNVTSLPGACAVTTLISQIPEKLENFCFSGFIPRNENQIKETVWHYIGENLIFYDSPERIIKTLYVIYKERGDIKITLGRELTKLFEEVITDNISKVIEHYKDGIKGEIVCIVYADKNSEDKKLDAKIKDLYSKGFKNKEISVILSSLFKLNKNNVYKRTLEIL